MSKILEAVLSHKDFTYPGTIYFNNDVKAYSQKKIKTNLPFKKYKSEYDDRIHGELAIWKYLYEKETNYDWYLLHHYRRHLTAYYDHFCIPEPIQLNCSVLQQTAVCHSFKLVDIFKQILSPEDFNILATTNMMIPYNMMLITRELLKGWLDYVEYHVQLIMKLLNIYSYEECLSFVKNDASFTSNILPNGKIYKDKDCSPKYQVRLFGFIVERLNTLFWLKNMSVLKPYTCQVELLEQGQHI